MSTEAAFWNALAEGYAAQPVANPDAFDRKIAITRARMNPDSVVLDIGCGTGSLALRLADAGAHVHGLDVSDEMVRIALGKAENQGVDNVTFHVGLFDETFTTFGPASLDGLCAYSILHLVPDHLAAVEQIYLMLKPGGFFISSTVVIGDSWLPLSAVVKVMHALGKAPAVLKLKAAQLVDDFRAAGFVDVALTDVGAKNTVAFIVARKPDAA